MRSDPLKTGLIFAIESIGEDGIRGMTQWHVLRSPTSVLQSSKFKHGEIQTETVRTRESHREINLLKRYDYQP